MLAEENVVDEQQSSSRASEDATSVSQGKAQASKSDADQSPVAKPSVAEPTAADKASSGKGEATQPSATSREATKAANGESSPKTATRNTNRTTNKHKKRTKRNAKRKRRATVRIARSERPDYHVVRRGDWLSKIAFRYHMSLRELKKLNKLKSDAIDVGHRLRLRATPRALAAVDIKKQFEATPPETQPEPTDAVVTVVALPELPPLPDFGPGAGTGAQTSSTTPAPSQPQDEQSDAPAAADTTLATVEIPTLAAHSVKPLSRARIALVLALLVLGLLTLHPRTRQLVANRLPGWMRREGVGDKPAYEIEVHSTRRVGSKQQILFFEVADTRLLVGISDGRMDLLHRWGDTVEAAGANGGTLAQQLQPADDVNATPTVRVAAVDSQPECATAPKLTPSAEQLLDTWRHTVSEQRSSSQFDLEGGSWWMEGATYAEKSRLSCDELVAATDGAMETAEEITAERQQVEESVLATLRSRRSDTPIHAQASTRGSQTRPRRPPNSHGGFRAAARLGRRPSASKASAEEQPEERSPTLKGNRLSFQL